MDDTSAEMTPAIAAAWLEWRDAERELDGKYQAHERARERRDRALATLRKLSTENK